MTDRGSEFHTFCKSGAEKCDMHFLVENEVISTKERVEKMEEKTRQSFSDLQKTLNDFIIEVRSYIGIQSHRDVDHQEVKSMVNRNTTDIGELKSAVKSISENSSNVSKAVVDINNNISKLTETLQTVNKAVLSKSEIEDIAQKAIIIEKSTKQDKWFESLPAKVSATVAVVSFIAFFTVKIVLLLLAVAP
jgi:hypothetical protein